jgi:Ala-tRNA(Pro) deacylase
MPADPHACLMSVLRASGTSFHYFSHRPCRTSIESGEARAAEGHGTAIGAKALILKSRGEFHLAVLPGPARLDSDRVRHIIGRFRFATPEEVIEHTELEIGTIPPFGRPVLPAIHLLLVDPEIAAAPEIGFNAARLDRSVLMTGNDYVLSAGPAAVATLTASKEK